MKRVITLGIIFVCSIILLSGCKYSDLTKTSNFGTPGVVNNIEPTEKISSWEPNTPFTVPNIAEINITSITSTEEIKPPKTSGVYSYQADQDGETYILAKGTFKNLLTDTFSDWDNFNGKLIYDNNYEYSMYVKFATESDNDFYTDPKPLQSLNAYFIASVPSELIQTDKTFTLKLQFTDNNDVDSDVYQYSFVFDNN